MQEKQRIWRMLIWERSVLLLSFWLAVIIFAVAFVWGNAAHFLHGMEGRVGLLDAALWFVRTFLLAALLGTVLNLLGHLFLIVADTVKRLRS
jgi:hypothetical protein